MTSTESEILSLPVEDTVWLLDITKKDLKTGTHNVTIVDKRAVVIGYQEFSDTHVFSREDLYNFVCSTILYPIGNRPRRPRYFIFKEQNLTGDLNISLHHLGIHSFNDDYSSRTAEHHVFRQCSHCNIRATEDFFFTCTNCKTVLFCCEKCNSSDQTHLEWCQSIMGYMLESDALMVLPFSFASVTTSRQFDAAAYKKFLEEKGVYNQGLWRRESISQNTQGLNNGFFGGNQECYVLPVEDSILEEPFQTCEPITDWESYYKQRMINLDSPVAVLLQWPLTLYWILNLCLPKDCRLFLAGKEKVVIDIIGVEKEVDIFPVFKELGYLIPGTQFHIRMFGKKIEKTLHNQSVIAGSVKVTFYRKLYHKVKGYHKPDLAVGFNAGLAAYPSWIETLCLLKTYNVPTYFTDYCRQSIDMARRCLTRNALNSSSRVDSFSSEIDYSASGSCSENVVKTDQLSPKKSTAMQSNERIESLGKDKCDQENLESLAKHVFPSRMTKVSVPENSDIVSRAEYNVYGEEFPEVGNTADRDCSSVLSHINFSDAVMNPFRGPIRVFCEDHNVPWFSNAFVFHLIYH